ncbi:P-loop containing nucleoside triphosphate hydrolase protein [Lipomyces japonicus]|uniref:P-loop containing nucleoside triphosphate hydrolase protein n=1 Tax=Lipomyces japonicus TaxID=56871 RepID=UPI0034CF980A
MAQGRRLLPFLAEQALGVLVTSIAMYYGWKAIRDLTDSRSTQKKQKQDTALKKFLDRRPGLTLDLDEHEQVVMAEVISPEDIHVGFDDIGGLDDIINDLRESVLYPLTLPSFFTHNSPLLQAPKGVLLYGPPGCGKTMLAKALAAESSANFLNIRISTVLDKWFGESNKIVAAIFSLALKIQPCIIFIDEIDSFLRARQSNDGEATSMLKAEFMALWDGLTTNGRILVLGATNRPNDIDSAFLRRMPKRFSINLPAKIQRKRILQLLLQGTALDESFDIDAVVDHLEGMSGSDIKEASRDAAMVAAREYFQLHFKDLKNVEAIDPKDLKMRPLKTSDFFVATSAVTHNSAPPRQQDPLEIPVD